MFSKFNEKDIFVNIVFNKCKKNCVRFNGSICQKKSNLKKFIENKQKTLEGNLVELALQKGKNKTEENNSKQNYKTLEYVYYLSSNQDFTSNKNVIINHLLEKQKRKISIKEESKQYPDEDDDLNIDELVDKTLNCNDEISTNNIKKFSNLKIKIPWPVPKLHLLESNIRCIDQKVKEEAKQLGFTINTKRFSTDEDNIIKRNFTLFCEMHNITEDPNIFFHKFFQVEQLKQFLRFLAHGLSNRLLFQILRRCQRLFALKKTGRFTLKEDKIILKLIQKYGFNHKLVSKILNRPVPSVYQRYKLLITNNIK